tara:strand:- start:302 stop:1462 length:1161 start_codon:yes stop_codon:yes gene_type:complete
MSLFNTKQKLNLARGILAKNSPLYVQFYITARCNLSCEQCNIIFADADNREMNINQIRSMAKNFAEIGVAMVLLIGGEPFARKDLPEIIEAFVSNGIHVRMQTNGLASETQLQKCVEAGGHDISISLDSLEGALQETINGGYAKSWERAIKAVSIINKIFPDNGTGFFGTVLMPRNIMHIPDVIEFATEIGWSVSLVPAHTSEPGKPRGFRTFDDDQLCTFKKEDYGAVGGLIDKLKEMKKKGYSLYDSEQYLDDIYRFIVGDELQWRKKNYGVCDSPNLYFAVQPNGDIKPCCDFKLNKSFPVYDEAFPKLYRDGMIHREVHKYTHNCSGCMYGSYPEMTITSRYLSAFYERFLLFNYKTKSKLKKLTYEEMIELACSIVNKKNK